MRRANGRFDASARPIRGRTSEFLVRRTVGLVTTRGQLNPVAVTYLTESQGRGPHAIAGPNQVVSRSCAPGFLGLLLIGTGLGLWWAS